MTRLCVVAIFAASASASCTATFPDGAISCAGEAPCPDGFFCHYDDLCYSFERPDLSPAGLAVRDPSAVLVPDQVVELAPSWSRTMAGVEVTLDGTLSVPGGPTETASYNFSASELLASCTSCYSLEVDSTARPSDHWDLEMQESLGDSEHTWTVHVGDSFMDVNASNRFYLAIETIFHHSIIPATLDPFGVDEPITRGDLAVLVTSALLDGGEPPGEGTVGETPYSCMAGGDSAFGDVLPEEARCRAIHFIAARGISVGCLDGTVFCPDEAANRGQLASFVALAVSEDSPAACGEKPFSDVLMADKFCPAITYLVSEAFDIVGLSRDECEEGTCTDPPCFCTTDDATRGEAASFLAGGFKLLLYEP